MKEYNTEEAFEMLTGSNNNQDIGVIIGTTKKEVKSLCGSNFDEYQWNRMVRMSRKAHKRFDSGTSLPWFDKVKKLWFWF